MGRSTRSQKSSGALRINWAEPRLLLLVGIPGSGKSTWARQMSKIHGCRVVSADEVRLELFGDLRAAQKHHEEVFRLVHQRLRSALDEGTVAIADATNLYPAARQPLYDLAGDMGVPAEIVLFTDHDEAERRNKLREGGERVPDHPMARMRQVAEGLDLRGEAPVHIF